MALWTVNRRAGIRGYKIIVPAVSFWMCGNTAFSTVLSSQRYSCPASQVQEAEWELCSHQFTSACLRCGSVECSLSMRPRLDSGPLRTPHTVSQSLRVSNTLETFSAVRLGSGENRGGRNWRTRQQQISD